MIYEFENTMTGEKREFHYLMEAAPSIGETIKKNGEEYQE